MGMHAGNVWRINSKFIEFLYPFTIHFLGQILGQKRFWGMIWGVQKSAFVRICPNVNLAISLKVLQIIEFAELFFGMP